jgi:hypothetical protein
MVVADGVKIVIWRKIGLDRIFLGLWLCTKKGGLPPQNGEMNRSFMWDICGAAGRGSLLCENKTRREMGRPLSSVTVQISSSKVGSAK